VRDAVVAALSAPGQGLAPLYGIAIDLTPFDVVGSAAPAIDVPFTRSAHAMPDVRPDGAPRSATRTISSARVTVVGQNGHQTFALVAVGMAAVALMFIVPNTPVRPIGSQVAAAPVYSPPASAVRHADAGPPVTGKTGPKSKRRAIRSETGPADGNPNNPAPEASDPPAEPLATTLERLRGGIR
jgi:hypothetical protein